MNTQSTFGVRNKYFQSQYAYLLRNVLVAEKVCAVDNSDTKTIQNPYGSRPTAAVQAVAGTYSVSSWTITDDALSVTDEVIYSEQIYGHDQFFAVFDIMAARLDEMMYAVAVAIDQYVINGICANAGKSYTTPSGGFTNGANVNTILGNLISLIAGYQGYGVPNGTFLIIEATDLVGFSVAGATSGFTVADSVLRNGFMNAWMGTDIYVVAAGTYQTATFGTQNYVNLNHRVYGVRGLATYASPRGIQYEEKGVSGKTGKEVVVYGEIGFKLWVVKQNLFVNITLTS